MTRSFLWTGVRLAALCSLLLLTACGGKQIPPRDGIPSPHLGTIRDMRSFPQDLTVFAQQAGADTPLLDSQAQAEQDARFNRIFFGPWDMRKPRATNTVTCAGPRTNGTPCAPTPV